MMAKITRVGKVSSISMDDTIIELGDATITIPTIQMNSMCGDEGLYVGKSVIVIMAGGMIDLVAKKRKTLEDLIVFIENTIGADGNKVAQAHIKAIKETAAKRYGSKSIAPTFASLLLRYVSLEQLVRHGVNVAEADQFLSNVIQAEKQYGY